MQVALSAEGQAAVERLLRNGWYTSAEQIVEIAVERLLDEEPNNARLRVLVQEGIDSMNNEPVITADYLAYVDESIREGLADADAGRTVPMEEVLKILRASRSVSGVAA